MAETASQLRQELVTTLKNDYGYLPEDATDRQMQHRSSFSRL